MSTRSDPEQRPAPAGPHGEGAAAESRREALQRKAHRAKLYTWTIVALVLVAILIALVAANTQQVNLDWVVGSGNASLVWIIFVAAAIGWALGVATSVLFRRRTRAPRGA